MVCTDERGLLLTTSNVTAVEHYDTTIRHYLAYQLDTMAYLQDTFDADPEFVMAHCLQGYLAMLAGMAAMRDTARQSLDVTEARTATITPRERLHVKALRAWYEGDVLRACDLWDAILVEYPLDILALRLQHFAIFWTGRSTALRDGIARVVDAWEPHVPGYSSVLGMYAFGLEEAGHYTEAEANGRRAVALNSDELWAIHAVAHVLEMQGRLRDGMAWLSYPLDVWPDRNAITSHIWWHAALYPLELGEYDRVLELYDQVVYKEQTDFYIDIQNMASLLWRLAFHGVDIGDRWHSLADICVARLDDHTLAFTDLHVMMALAAAGRYAAAEQLLTALRHYADTSNDYAAGTMTVATVPLCEGILAYAKGSYDAAVDHMYPMRYEYACIGGSHAQRDVFVQFLIEAALKSQRWHLARALLAERVAQRPHSRGNWLKYATALTGLGDDSRADAARQRAAEQAVG